MNMLSIKIYEILWNNKYVLYNKYTKTFHNDSTFLGHWIWSPTHVAVMAPTPPCHKAVGCLEVVSPRIAGVSMAFSPKLFLFHFSSLFHPQIQEITVQIIPEFIDIWNVSIFWSQIHPKSIQNFPSSFQSRKGKLPFALQLTQSGMMSCPNRCPGN